MKLQDYAKLIIPLIVAITVRDVSAGALRGQGQRELAVGSSAYHNGRGKAARLWRSGTYNCDFRDITRNFIPDVKRRVYRECDDTYWLSSRSRRDCEKGAVDWATEKANTCTSVTDCSGFGLGPADGIAEDYCPSEVAFAFVGGSGPKRPKLIPRECKKMARNKCRSKVVEIVGQRVAAGMCGDIRRTYDIDFDYLEDECDDEVSKLVKDINQETRWGD